MFAVANSVFTLARAFTFAYSGLEAAVKLHGQLLMRVVAAPVDFFDRTPVGRILNR
jgi:ATP-binding cassette subfamily C (CFTR/MRP) protein 10